MNEMQIFMKKKKNNNMKQIAKKKNTEIYDYFDGSRYIDICTQHYMNESVRKAT